MALSIGDTQVKIGISGAAETGHCGVDAYDKALELGREVARQGAVLITGATTGFPLWVAMGAKQEKGTVVGFSPANSEREHIEAYNLPIEYHDLIVYTGFGYPGRDLIFTRSTDALLFGCGRIGTIHEFTIAFEDKKPIGIYEGSWEIDEVFKDILAHGHRPNEHIVFDDNPKAIVERMISMTLADRRSRSAKHFEPVEG
jgi:hypothetical protein